MKVILATLAFLLILAVLYTEANEGEACYSYSSEQRWYSGWKQGAAGRWGWSRIGCKTDSIFTKGLSPFLVGTHFCLLWGEKILPLNAASLALGYLAERS